jgi:hypothetical protein
MTLHTYITIEKVTPKLRALIKRMTQSKQSPIGRKIVHSGPSGFGLRPGGPANDNGREEIIGVPVQPMADLFHVVALLA